MRFQVEILEVDQAASGTLTSLAVYEVESTSENQARVDGLRIFRETVPGRDLARVFARARSLEQRPG